MVMYEWKKLLFRRKGLAIILLLLVAELAGLLLFTRPYDQELEDNRQVYESYLAQVEGPLTQEKRAYLEEEMLRLDAIHADIAQLKDDYYAGNITEAQYRQDFDRLSVEDAKYTGLAKLYTQYIFVREMAERSFLYPGGWEVLLTAQEPDYLFLLALVILLTPIFCEEYACRMHEILLCQKRSAKYQVLSKVTVALTLTFLLTAILQTFSLVYCALRFGLPQGGFSLQSLFSFGNAGKHMSLWQGFWLQFALKELGYLYAALLILFLSVVLKNFARTLMAGIVILVLPFLTVAGNEVFVPIPGPWALTIGSIYLNGGQAELLWKELGLLILGVLLIMGLLLLGIRSRNTNYQLKRKTARKALLLCLPVLLLTGCAPKETRVCVNLSTSGWYEWEDYLLVPGNSGQNLIHKPTATVIPFPLSPLSGTIYSSGSCYGEGDQVYYLKTTTHHPDSGIESITQDCDLVKLNLSTMKESVVYQCNEETSWFFGLLDLETSFSLTYNSIVFLHENALYYRDNSEVGGLHKMDLLTGARQVVLPSFSGQNLGYDGENLYYLDNYNRLVIRCLDSGAEQAIDQVVASSFLLTSEGIYFGNLREGSTLAHYDPDSGAVTKLGDVPIYRVFWDESYLWFQDTSGILYRMDKDGSNQIPIDTLYLLAAVPSGDSLYLFDYAADAYYTLNKDTLECRPLGS